MPCPKCVNEYTRIHLEQWIHGGNCNGRLLIDSNAIVHCEKCGKTAPLSKMRITCDSHKHINASPFRTEFASAVSIGSIGVIDNKIHWFKSILDHI